MRVGGEKVAFAVLAFGGSHAGDQCVGQFSSGVPASNRLPVEQSGIAVAEVDVAGMRVAVSHRVRLSVNDFRDSAVVVDDEATVPASPPVIPTGVTRRPMIAESPGASMALTDHGSDRSRPRKTSVATRCTPRPRCAAK